MLSLTGLDGYTGTKSWYRLHFAVQLINYCQNDAIPWDLKNMLYALKCVGELRNIDQDKALRN
jgi:hypothetical protein